MGIQQKTSGNEKASIRHALRRIIAQEFPQLEEEQVFLGKVVNIRNTPGEEYYGTVDVEPYNGDPIVYKVRTNGKSKTASRGRFVFPKLNSDVIVCQFDDNNDAYIAFTSHILEIQEIVDEQKVTKVEAVTTADPELADDVEVTGKYSQVTQDPTGFIEETTDGTDSTIKTTTKTGIVTEVTDGSDTVAVEHSKTEFKVGSGAGAYESMVLGDTLATLLSDFLQGLVDMRITTQLGPQPALNVATFVNLKTQVDNIKSAIAKLQ